MPWSDEHFTDEQRRVRDLARAAALHDPEAPNNGASAGEATGHVAAEPENLPPFNLGLPPNENPVPESIEALMMELADVEDPWVFLQRVRAGVLDVEDGGISEDVPRDRMRFTSLFLARCAARSDIEVDALLVAGRSVFRYTTSTAKDEIKRLRTLGGGGQVKAACTVVGHDEQRRVTLLAEAVLTSDPAHRVKYLVARYNPDEQTCALDEELYTEVVVGGVTYLPLNLPEIEEEDILFPTGVEEYGSEEELFQEVLAYIRRTFYAHEDDDRAFLYVLAGYVMMTWVFDRLDVLGYLRFIGRYSTGKSHLLNTVAHACFRPVVSLGTMSVPVLFRSLELYRGTLAIDEADFTNQDKEEVFRILNGGYTKRPGTVMRCVGDTHDVKRFRVFGPKILAGRSPFPDEALESRCFRYKMKNLTGDDIPDEFPLAYTDRQREQAHALHNKLLLWRLRKFPLTRFDEFARVRDRHGQRVTNLRGQQIVLAILSTINSQELRDRLIDNVTATAMAIEEVWYQSREGRVICTFFDLICQGQPDGRPDYGKTITLDELDARLNAGLSAEKDRVAKEEIGSILGGGGRGGHKGLLFKSARHTKTRRSGYIGGKELQAIVRKYNLVTYVRKQPVVNKQPVV